ncbi:hypothetical protein [Vulcanisaeta souniana]|uniref:Uncharacterized protein n=2 Tax=Vulcanisaeta souniana JCM 11219 TaxID=1293586 RepID=A0A830EGX4_9CREN|nr:hypothetical protein [Vulcanisaeta souniana]GGI70299.1 hypothetical protein GCM10007112_04070 [Vulcanisaeta souniana JCM 11219]
MIITALVIMVAYSSLLIYAHIGRVVLRYSGPGYVVEYIRYPELPWPLNILTFSPPSEYPLINIAITNAPTPYPHTNARFFIYATGPSVGGFVDVGHYLSNSTSFVINVGNYTAYALELDNYLRMTPDMAGPSIILFISTITNTSKGPSVVTGFVTIPIIPMLARGSVVDVVINYTRVAKVGLTVNATGGAAPSFQDPSTQPPSTASAGCVVASGGPYKSGEECWYWQLNTVLLTRDNTPFPVVAQVVRSSEVNYVGESDVRVGIELSQSTYTGAGFTLSLAIPTNAGVNVEIPGIGYILQLQSNQNSYTLLNYECYFTNPLVPITPLCEYANVSANYAVSAPSISSAGAYGIAIIGYLEIANYTEYECVGSLGDPCIGTVEAVQWAIMTWFAAYNNTNVNEFEAEPLDPGVIMKYIQTLLNNKAFNTITFPSGTGYITAGDIDT